MKKVMLLLLMTVLLSACQNMRVPQSPLLPLLERKSGLIAYIGIDGNIYTSDQAGNHVTAYTEDASLPSDTSAPFRYYAYPTWSLDGERLGFVGVSGQGSISAADVYIAGVEKKAEKVFSTEGERPFYLYWSPDNTNLGFLSATANSQAMILQTVSSEPQDTKVIDTASPYYFSWAPDGKTMIVHAGSTQSAAPEHLSFLKVDSEIVEDVLETTPAPFQSPAWSPDGSRILMTRLEDEKREIIVTNAQGEFEKSLGTFDLNAAFAWSHDSEMAAYIEGNEAVGAGALGALHVVDVSTSEELFNDEEAVYAFFWSPDDKKIAYFIPSIAESPSSSSGQENSDTQPQQQLLLQLKVLDVNTGKSKDLYTFPPTDQFAAVLPYFDQYHQSATIWSPDSNNLVLSFMTEEGAPGIAVAAASGQLQPRVITQGYVAFWSWR